MHAEPEPKHQALALPPATAVERPTSGEWAIGVAFVLAALVVVALVAWSIAGLAA